MAPMPYRYLPNVMRHAYLAVTATHLVTDESIPQASGPRPTTPRSRRDVVRPCRKLLHSVDAGTYVFVAIAARADITPGLSASSQGNVTSCTVTDSRRAKTAS